MNRRVLYQLSCVMLLLCLVQPVSAHGGGILQIGSEPAGPFSVSVWTSPTRLEAGELAHVTGGGADGNGEPVLDAAVLVEIVSLETGEVWFTEATTEQATNKLFYEGDLRLPEVDGRYNMTIQIENDQGRGDVTFAIELLPAGETNWLMIAFIGLGLILSMTMFRLWEKQTTSSLPPRKG